jgi:hypothetical protein
MPTLAMTNGYGRPIMTVWSTAPAPSCRSSSSRTAASSARILVGPDAYVFDALARVTPTHYYDVMARLEKRLRSRQAASR